MSSKSYNWGIVGTGKIVKSFIEGLKILSAGNIYGVASRNLDTAKTFAQNYNIPTFYGSYNELFNDPKVDIVYIGTPHNCHFQNVKDALNAGKNVLCEKPFTLNGKEAEELVSLARIKKVFLMEAMWNRFQPWYAVVKKILDAGTIGEIDHLKAELAYAFPFDPKHRVFNMDLAGGSLLDLGVYPISITSLFMGVPSEIISVTHLCPTGADDKVNMIFKYPQGKSAELMCSSRFIAKNNVILNGPLGFIEVHGSINKPEKVTLYKNNERPVVFDCPVEGNGLNYEAQAVMDMLDKDNKEHPLMPLNESIQIMKVMDKIRSDAAIVYPEEK